MSRHLRAVKRVAQRGDSFAQRNLGAHLASGEGVECDLKRAVFWYREAAARKEPEAVYNLGLMHVADVRRGVKMLERAAELGSPDAQQFLGDVLVAGLYGPKSDPKRAALVDEIRSLIPGSAAQMRLGGSSATRQKPPFRQAIACRNGDSATSFCGSMCPVCGSPR